MASCGKCGKNVGCGCNLTQGYCVTCYAEKIESGEQVQAEMKRKSIKRVKFTKPPVDPPENTQFIEILQTQTLTREEKLKRINNILEQARN